MKWGGKLLNLNLLGIKFFIVLPRFEHAIPAFYNIRQSFPSPVFLFRRCAPRECERHSQPDVYSSGLGLDKTGSTHFIITQSEAFGPLTTIEVIELLENNNDLLIQIKWISPCGQTPVLLFEWMDDFRFELKSEIASGLLQSSETPLSMVTMNSAASQDSLDRLTLGRPSGFRVKRKGLGGLRDIAALLGLGLLGGFILYTGVRSMRPIQPTRFYRSSFNAQPLGGTPDSLRTYQQLLEAKILRNPTQYSRALLHMSKNSELFPPGLLPSLEFTVAQALVHLDSRELDKQIEWKEILKSLPSSARQSGLAVVAYELSRVKIVRDDLLKNQTTKKRKGDSVSAALNEIGIVLERLTRVVATSNPDNGLVHGLYLAKALALSLVTVSEHYKQVSQESLLFKSLMKIPALYPFLKPVDKELVETLQRYVQLKLTGKGTALKVPVDELWSLHSNSQYICQLNDYGSAADVILYMLSEASRARQKLPKLAGLFEGCFVGLRPYTKVKVTSFTEESPLNLGYVQTHSPDRGLLNEFRVRYPTMHQALIRSQGKSSAVGDWLLALHFNGVLGSQFKLSKGFFSQSRTCGNVSIDSAACLQALWYESRRSWKDVLPFLTEAQDFVRPSELALLVQRFTLDAAREIIASQSKNKSRELAELFANLRNFGVADDPELQLVLDYARSIEDAS